MVGAVLTQSTSWTNVEKAIRSLKDADALSPAAIRRLPQDELARIIYSAGFHNSKARKLKALAVYLGSRFNDDLDAMGHVGLADLRAELLDVHGIGEETADGILLYAVGVPSFVIDAYTRRLFARLGLAPVSDRYADYQRLFETNLSAEPDLFGEYHALVVHHGKMTCRKQPGCQDCCLLDVCSTGRNTTSQQLEAAR
jgi:endonuclease-3 related protein